MSVRSVCEKGFHTYLAEQHRSSMKQAVSKGIFAGAISSGLLALANHYGNLGISWYYVASPFALITASSVAHQAIGESSQDLEHKEAFDAVCGKYAKDDEDTDGE
tara:strand:- start:175 stop:489 length:315 start_codon:yes stop_codon:yes gene_type:complete